MTRKGEGPMEKRSAVGTVGFAPPCSLVARVCALAIVAEQDVT